MRRHIEIIPAELEMRMRRLSVEAERLRPAVESLAERAWHALQDYNEELDPIFDMDEADKRTSVDRLFNAVLTLGTDLASVTDSFADGEPEWRQRAKAEREARRGH